jgi:UDP-glucose 4-epimerase
MLGLRGMVYSTKSMEVLITGCAGYIGSQATLTLLLAGFDVVVLDNLCNSSAESLNRVAQIVVR